MSRTPLHEAVINNDLEEVYRLSESLGDIDFADEHGFTPKELAFLLGKGSCAEAFDYELPSLKVVPPEQYIVDYEPVGRFLESMGVAYSPTIRFIDYDSIVKTIKKCPRILQHSSTGDECRALAEKYGDKIYSGHTANVTIAWLGEPLRYGLMTNRNLNEGDYIGCYTGLIRPLNRITPLINGYCVLYPTKWLTGGLCVIDARFYGNELRFVNHSDAPNLRGEWALDRGLLHLLFFADEDIPRGAQLTIDYGQSYWSARRKDRERIRI